MGLRLALTFRRVDPSRGGAETYVADLCRALVSAGHSVDLHAESWIEGALPVEVRCTPVPTTGRTAAARIRSFAENAAQSVRERPHDCSVGFINTWGTDVLIPQGGVHEGSLLSNARRFPAGWRRRLYIAAKRANPKARLYREIEARQYHSTEGARLVVAVSRMVREHLARFHGVPGDRVRVVPNAIDARRLAVPDPSARRSVFRRSLDLGARDLVGLFVGHNFRLKGLGPLLAGLRLRLDRNPSARPIRLVVCGGGRLSAFAREARRLGLADSVRLVGFAPDIRSAFHGSDFFVLPTYYDPCSLVVFEALACGLPVITTRCNGAGEVMTEGREGHVIQEPDATAELADALDAMTDDRRRAVMAEAAARLGALQSFDRHVARLVQVFEEIARQRAQRPFAA